MNDKPLDNISAALSGSLLRELQAASDRNALVSEPARRSAKAVVVAPVPRDWSATVQLVHEAHEAMRISEERVQDLEAQLADVIAQAKDEIAQFSRRAERAEQALSKVERELEEADTRARDAEAWLHQLHETLATSFGPMLPPRS